MKNRIRRACRSTSQPARQRGNQSKPKTQLSLERLEGREMFAGFSFGAAAPLALAPVQANPSFVQVYQPPGGISINNGVVHIKGSSNADSAVVTASGDILNVSMKETQLMSLDINTVIPVVVPSEAQFDLEDITRVKFYGHQGNDSFVNFTSVPSTAYGHAGSDVLTGGRGNVYLYGGPGNDRFWRANEVVTR